MKALSSRKRRRILRAVKRAASPEAAAALGVLVGRGVRFPGSLPDEDLVRLRCVMKLGGNLEEAIAALEAASRLRPRDKFAEFRYWFKPRGEGQTIRLLDEAVPVIREHRIVKGETHDARIMRWIQEGRAAQFSIGSGVKRAG